MAVVPFSPQCRPIACERHERMGRGWKPTAASQLYAVVEAGEAALARLQAALDAAPIASVLIGPAAGASLEAGSAKPLIELAQKANAAALLAGDAQLARTLRADGVHLDAGKDLAAAYEQARGILGDRGIVGVDVGISRHDAMTLAEAGADYIAFGAPPISTTATRAARGAMSWSPGGRRSSRCPAWPSTSRPARRPSALSRRRRRLRRGRAARRRDAGGHARPRRRDRRRAVGVRDDGLRGHPCAALRSQSGSPARWRSLCSARGERARRDQLLGRPQRRSRRARPGSQEEGRAQGRPVKIIKTVPGTPTVLPTMAPPVAPSSQTAPVAPARPRSGGPGRADGSRPTLRLKQRRPRPVLPPASTPRRRPRARMRPTRPSTRAST